MTEILRLILLLAVNALSVIGFNYATMYADVKAKGILEDSKNILWRVRYYGNKYLPVWLQKPIYNCLRCMPSIHASYVYFPAIIFMQYDLRTALCLYPVYVLMLSGTMILIESKFQI